MPARKDLSIWKGNTFSMPIRLKTVTGGTATPVNVTGSTLVFRVVWPGGSFEKDLTLTNAALGEASLSLSVAETRGLPTGRNRYEIERRAGADQTTLIYGEVVASEWANND